MNEDNKKDNNTDEELDELLKAIEKIEEESKNNKGKKRKRSLLAIEFGGVFHHNIILNFLFSVLLNFALGYLIIEIFGLAEYDSLLYLFLFILGFSFIEYFYKHYIMLKHFSLILKSFGTIFYFGYILIVYVLDLYVFKESFSFNEGVFLMVYITFFTIIRYFLSVYMKRKIRGY